MINPNIIHVESEVHLVVKINCDPVTAFLRFDAVIISTSMHGTEKHHNNLTPNELKLCAYLRMNLCTKEMARLMNISVRGVEVSRYRLRKKLQLPTETNLTTYLLDLHAELQE